MVPAVWRAEAGLAMALPTLRGHQNQSLRDFPNCYEGQPRTSESGCGTPSTPWNSCKLAPSSGDLTPTLNRPQIRKQLEGGHTIRVAISENVGPSLENITCIYCPPRSPPIHCVLAGSGMGVRQPRHVTSGHADHIDAQMTIIAQQRCVLQL